MELIKYLPEYMAKIKELEIINKVEQTEFNIFNSKISDIQKEMFISTAGEIGISRFEKMLNIENLDSDMDYRRLRILLKLSGFNNGSIEKRLSDIVGEDNYLLNVDIDNKYVEVRLLVRSEKYLDEVAKLLDKIVPCNLKLNVGILYSSHKMTSKYTHKYLAGFKNSDVKLIGV